jgi:hypothetical protein
MEHLQRMGTRLPRAIWERLVGELRLRHSSSLSIHIVIQLIQRGPKGRDHQVLLILMATILILVATMAVSKMVRVVILAVVLVPVIAVW